MYGNPDGPGGNLICFLKLLIPFSDVLLMSESAS